MFIPASVPQPTEIGEIRGGLGVGLDRPCGRKQMGEFDQGRRGSAILLDRPLEHSTFVPQSQRANPAEVIDRQQIVQRIERSVCDRRARRDAPPGDA